MSAFIAWAAGVVRICWVARVGVINIVTSLLFFWGLVQAQNLMADLSSAGSSAEFVFWSGVFAFTFVAWAFPVHYATRRSLDQLTNAVPGRAHVAVPLMGHCCLVAWLPRALGLLPFAALAIGIWGARSAVSEAASTLPTARATMQQGAWLFAADGATATAFALFVYFRRSWIPAHWDGKWLHPLSAIATGLVFVVAYFAPIETSTHIPRALLVPPLFGSLVLIAGWLTRVADRTGFPFLAAAAILCGILTATNTTFDALRILPNAAGDQRLSMAEAVAVWKRANGCSASRCPTPIVVAIDGGASRAAFTAATFIGDLLDRMPAANADEAATPGRRIFAISGVSGGSYGASVIQAALLDAQRAGHGPTPPCRSAQTTWFGFEDWARAKKGFTWRQCLQALTSGDYLSPTIIGLAFRDFIAPPWQKIPFLPPMPDRAALLEMTWERQYAATLEPERPFFEGGEHCAADSDIGLCRRAAHAAMYIGQDGSRMWMPLLLLNGTSVATGRRIISSDLASTKVGASAGGSLYSQAYDLREVMSDQCPSKPPPVSTKPTEVEAQLAIASRQNRNERTLTQGVCAEVPALVQGPDVRLSTAALTSARFPIISPAGIFQMEGTIYGDQVVDGGYYENSGLTTARDIVLSLKANGLDAAIVSIGNNPAFDVPSSAQLKACRANFHGPGFTPAACTGLPRRPAITPLEPPANNGFLGRIFGLLLRPFQTLVATGDGHSDEVLAALAAAPPPGGFFRLRVDVTPTFASGPDMPPDPQCDKLADEHQTMTMTNVSMSWWLSAAVQADLDIQRCSQRNRLELKGILTLLDKPGSG